MCPRCQQQPVQGSLTGLGELHRSGASASPCPVSSSISRLGSSEEQRAAGALLPRRAAWQRPGAASSVGTCTGLVKDPWGHLVAPKLGLVALCCCCPRMQEGRPSHSPRLRLASLALGLKHPNCFLCRPRIPVTLNMKMVMPSWSVLWVAGLGGGPLWGCILGRFGADPASSSSQV